MEAIVDGGRAGPARAAGRRRGRRPVLQRARPAVLHQRRRRGGGGDGSRGRPALRAELTRALRRQPAVGPDGGARRRRARPVRGSCARCSPASSRRDMGLLAPDFGALAGYRHAIGARRRRDLRQHHARVQPLGQRRPVAERARGAAYLGADALLISGPQAGVERRPRRPRARQGGRAGTPGARQHRRQPGQRCTTLLAVADGVIVGTSLKVDGDTWNPVDPARVVEMVDAGPEPRSARWPRAMAKQTRLYFATDVHGSESASASSSTRPPSTGRTSWCWAVTWPARRSRRSTSWAAAATRTRSAGRRYDIEDGSRARRGVEQLIRDHGYYP